MNDAVTTEEVMNEKLAENITELHENALPCDMCGDNSFYCTLACY